MLEADWLKKTIRHTDKIDAICDLAANLVRAYIGGNAELLCLHGAAANFVGKLVVFPSKCRAGKSVFLPVLPPKTFSYFATMYCPLISATDVASPRAWHHDCVFHRQAT